MGRWGRVDVQEGRGWLTGPSHIHLRISQEEQMGSEADRKTQGSSMGKLKTQNLWP